MSGKDFIGAGSPHFNSYIFFHLNENHFSNQIKKKKKIIFYQMKRILQALNRFSKSSAFVDKIKSCILPAFELNRPTCFISYRFPIFSNTNLFNHIFSYSVSGLDTLHDKDIN